MGFLRRLLGQPDRGPEAAPAPESPRQARLARPGLHEQYLSLLARSARLASAHDFAGARAANDAAREAHASWRGYKPRPSFGIPLPIDWRPPSNLGLVGVDLDSVGEALAVVVHGYGPRAGLVLTALTIADDPGWPDLDALRRRFRSLGYRPIDPILVDDDPPITDAEADTRARIVSLPLADRPGALVLSRTQEVGVVAEELWRTLPDTRALLSRVAGAALGWYPARRRTRLARVLTVPDLKRVAADRGSTAKGTKERLLDAIEPRLTDEEVEHLAPGEFYEPPILGLWFARRQDLMAAWAGTMIQRTYRSILLSNADADVRGATLTDTDCPICSEVPRYIPARDFERAPSPPFHIGCRCTAIPDMR